MMIPTELVVITNYVTITNADLRNTFTGLILPSVTSVFYIYLLKENFSQIPDELYYAAKVDGTSDLKYLFKVLIPICKPTIVTITILKVIECWNSYVWPRLVTDDQAYFLVSNGIQEIRENGFGRENIPAMMAAVNFSCPYPKGSYKNHRLTNGRFLAIYRDLLEADAEVHQKTDNMHFFEYSIEEFSKAGWQLKNISLDLHHSDFEGNIVTEYEQRFASQGCPIYRLEAFLPEL